MSNRSAIFKLTIFTVVTVLATGLLAKTIGNIQLGPKTTYRAQFTDVTGLLPGDDIRIAGVVVGRVQSTDVAGKLAEVTFRVEKDVKLTTAVRAKVRYRNLLGQRYIALTQPNESGTPLRAGGLIPVGQTEPALDLTVLFNGFRPLLETVQPEDVNALAEEIVKTLQGEGATVDSLLAHTASLTNDLASRDVAIGRVITNLSKVAGTVADRDETLSTFIAELQRLTTGLAGDRDAIGDSIINIDQLAGLTADLLHEARPNLDASIKDLNEIVAVAAKKAPELDAILKGLPLALAALNRGLGYGAWLNLYVLDLKVQIGDTIIPIPPSAIAAALEAPR